ncbi:MAG: polysaccharide biosynthesis tyrosine autokinase [Acidobacteria bacterium]|uniref:non-specific protein-tyrosine kinase n=1 Tax=Candidatus Polarisedimenticola svalbardensis TaxID=2886004 RepID=A0A8J6XV11_9BACT|nr:polysaccharide biosynthesis tyrosine autokinase [Candidatus Polarisedimenticola svalbardensis]
MQNTEQTQSSLLIRDVHLRDYWKIIWQGRWTLISVFFLVVTLVGVWTFLQTPVYKAASSLEIQTHSSQITPGQDISGLGASGYGFFAEEKYVATQVEIIRSRDVAGKAFRSLALDADPRFQGMDDPVNAFRSRIQVMPRRETGLIEVSIEGGDRFEITKWVNAVVDAYSARNLQKARNNIESSVELIKQQLAPLANSLREAESTLMDDRGERQIYNPENQQEAIRKRMGELNTELAQVSGEVNRLKDLLEKVDEIRASGGDPMALPELAQDPVLQEQNRNRVQLLRDLEAKKLTLRPGHRDYKAKEAELETVNLKIEDQLYVLYNKIQTNYDLKDSQRKYLNSELRKMEAADYEMERARSTFAMAQTDVESQKQVFDLISRTLQDVSLSAGLLANNVSVLDKATPPLYPIKPKKKMNLILGALLGLFSGIGVVFFLDYLDHTLRSPEDVEKVLNLNTLSVIPRFEEGDRANRAIKEAYQTLRTGLIFSSNNRERKVLLITSTVPQEGKSSTIARLGQTLAGPGEKVLILDCDLRRPTQHFHLGTEREPGLTSYLAAPRDVTDWKPFVRPTSYENLDVLTAGPIPPNPPELLGGERFRDLLDSVRNDYDWVLIDSPPSMSLSDTSLLADLADMTLLVVQHNQTDKDVIQKNVQHLKRVGANLIGAILNNVDIQKAYQKDYYYAGYYYFNEETGKTSRKKKPAAAGSGPA